MPSCHRSQPRTATGYRVRRYEIASGRAEWQSRDPIGEKGGINLYGYVGNSPVNRTDPLGLVFLMGGWSSSGNAAYNAAMAVLDGDDSDGGASPPCKNENGYTDENGYTVSNPGWGPDLSGENLQHFGFDVLMAAAMITPLGRLEEAVVNAPRVIKLIAPRYRFSTMKATREAAELKSTIGKAVKDVGPHGPHFHPLNDAGKQLHDHYYFPWRFW